MKVVLPSDAKADPYKHQRAWRERNKEALSAYQKSTARATGKDCLLKRKRSGLLGRLGYASQ